MKLTDVQWCALDILMRCRQKGINRVARAELLHTSQLPQAVTLKLTWALITMPAEIVIQHGVREFEITEEGVQLYNLRFGNGSNPQPTHVADSVICLPGPEHYSRLS